MFAQYVEHKDWTFWQEFTAASKFRGKYLACYPIGCCHLVFHKTKSHYTWGKAVVTVHNIIVGRLWIDQVKLLTDWSTGERGRGLIQWDLYTILIL